MAKITMLPQFTMRTDLLFLTALPDERIESRVMAGFNDGIRDRHSSLRTKLMNVFASPKWHLFRAIRQSGVVVVHSPLIFFLFPIVAARMMGKRVTALIWDVYPVRIGAERYDRRPQRRLADMLENFGLRFCHLLFVPTADFLKEKQLIRARTLNLWPPLSHATVPRPDRASNGSEIKIVFGGQINATRGLEDTLAVLDRVIQHPFKLIVASANPLPAEIAQNERVSHVGFVPAERLEALMHGCDLGLVSLARQFDSAAFPSKTLEYVAAGLPTIYVGPPLAAYVDILEESGVGWDLGNMQTLDEVSIRARSKDFAARRRAFEQAACLNGEGVDRFVSLAMQSHAPAITSEAEVLKS